MVDPLLEASRMKANYVKRLRWSETRSTNFNNMLRILLDPHFDTTLRALTTQQTVEGWDSVRQGETHVTL